MNTPELNTYIKTRLASGVSPVVIKSELLASHWKMEDIEEALLLHTQPITDKNTPTPPINSSLPPAMDIIREAIEKFKAHPLLYGGIIIIPGAINALGKLAISLLPVSTQQQAPAPYVLLGVFMAILTNTISSVGSLALLISIRDIQTSTSISDAYKKALHLLLSYWWVLFLSGVITLGGLALFIIPGIICAIYFAFTEYALVFDDNHGMNAVHKSKKIISGYVISVGWRAFIMACVALLFSLPSLVISSLTKSIPMLQIPSQLITLFTASIITPIAVIAESIIYTHIKLKKSPEELVL